jgi:hypothetical protein
VDINAAFPSKYVKASEVPEEGLAVTIDRVEMADVDGKGQMKPVLYFRRAKKGMVLNITNSKKIASLLGSSNTDNWEGQSITLYQGETEYQGETVACIRVRAAKGVQQAPVSQSPVLPPQPRDDVPPVTDEEIPF